VARFVSTGLVATGARTGRLTGNLTLNGVDAAADLPGHFQWRRAELSGKPTVGFSAEGTIKRSDYRVAAALPAAIVGDEVRLLIEAEFNQD
jgi:polyisoprenoid-binding protein YceI